MTSTEQNRSAGHGYFMLLLGILFLLGAIASLVMGIRTENPMWIISIIGGVLLGVLTLVGLFIVNPNDARVLVLFGVYKGTVRENGFYWTNPFMIKKKITLRARNLNGERIKVNDKLGNPIERSKVEGFEGESIAQWLRESRSDDVHQDGVDADRMMSDVDLG